MKRTPLKRSRPVRDRAGEQRWYQALGPICEACGTGRYLELHHGVYAQRVRRAGGDVWNESNAVTICKICHAAHHSRRMVLGVSCLPDSVLEFAACLLGPAAAGYLRRYYHDDGDPRLDALDKERVA